VQKNEKGDGEGTVDLGANAAGLKGCHQDGTDLRRSDAEYSPKTTADKKGRKQGGGASSENKLSE